MFAERPGTEPRHHYEPSDPSARRTRPGRAPPQLPEIELRELFRKLWRRKGVILGVMATLMALAVVVVGQLTPQYTATADVMVNPRQSHVVDMEAVVTGLPLDQETIQSELEIIRPRALSQRVIEKPELHRVADFNPDLREPTAPRAPRSDERRGGKEGGSTGKFRG